MYTWNSFQFDRALEAPTLLLVEASEGKVDEEGAASAGGGSKWVENAFVVVMRLGGRRGGRGCEEGA